MIEVRDANNVVILDAASRPLKIITFVSIGTNYTAGTKSGSFFIQKWADWPNNTPVFVRMGMDWITQGFNETVYISGSTFYWDYPRTDPEYNATYNYYNARPNATYMIGMF